MNLMLRSNRNFRIILALGYRIHAEPPETKNLARMKTVRLSNRSDYWFLAYTWWTEYCRFSYLIQSFRAAYYFSMYNFVFLSQSYIQPNGYKPAPLDLNHIQLNEQNTELVLLLAENTHNVWCRDRIIQGWTYGPAEVCFLIPISMLPIYYIKF